MAGDLPVKCKCDRTRFLTLEVVRHGLDAFQALEQCVSNDPREYKCAGVDSAHQRDDPSSPITATITARIVPTPSVATVAEGVCLSSFLLVYMVN